MRWSDIPFDPPRRMLRQFAWLWLAFFGGLAGYQGLVRGDGNAAVALAALALTVGPIGLWRPGWVRPVFVAWMVLAFPIGWTVSLAILGLLYFGLFTPIALAFRLAGRDALRRMPAARGESYWTPKPMPADVRRYLKQF